MSLGDDFLYSAGAVFNLLCGARDETNMAKIEQYFGSKVTEVF